MASHTLDDEEYQGILNARQTALDDCAKLRAELALAKQQDPADRIRPLNMLVRDAFTIVRFAVANLNPENTRGWPVNALEGLADRIAALPDYTTDDGDFANDLRAFARDCDAYALHRERMRAEKLAADASAPKGDLDGAAS